MCFDGYLLALVGDLRGVSGDVWELCLESDAFGGECGDLVNLDDGLFEVDGE